MSRVVQARLDGATERLLLDLRRRLGLSDSQLVRRGLAALAEQEIGHPAPPKVTGIGRFASGHSDLGSNRAHLRGFGRS